MARLSPLSLNSKLCTLNSFIVGPALLISSWGQAQPIADPVPGTPSISGITLQIEEFVQIPGSSRSAPRARINHLKPMRDGRGRVMVNDLRGPFYVIDDGAVSLYMDFEDEFPRFTISPGLGTGFTSFAFHPDFANNGTFYTAHSEGAGSGQANFTGPVRSAPVALQGVIVEWIASDPSASAFSGSKREILRVDLTHTIHGMQEIAFNPNALPGGSDYGLLYICIGDAGSTIRGFPLNAHRLDSVLGTILRIDPAGNNSANGNYGIPVDNPGEIWAYGFRNPHRISWDSAGDGKMLSGDIGERNIEELNWIEPGRDYGWNEREGTFVINPEFENNPQNGEREEVFALPPNDEEFGYTYPVAQYDQDEGRAIVSGFVYRGSLAGALAGKFLFGDIVNGKIFVVEADTLQQGYQSEIEQLELELDGQKRTMLQIVGDSRVDLRFGIDAHNELYLLEKRWGRIYKVMGVSGTESEPATAGKFVNISTRAYVGTGDEVMIGGFIIGEGAQQVLIQAVGPELANAGIFNALADPVLTVTRIDTGEVLIVNDHWGDDPEREQLVRDLWEGSPNLMDGSASSAAVLLLDPGNYTATVEGKEGTTGVALVEVYQID
ncbi:MAG: cytochrome C [Opitutae bacterium]|nr:cytochrome C [Opitutae bacterium]